MLKLRGQSLGAASRLSAQRPKGRRRKAANSELGGDDLVGPEDDEDEEMNTPGMRDVTKRLHHTQVLAREMLEWSRM